MGKSMKDLVLFSELWDGAHDVAAVVPLLEELSARPLSRRVPWLAALAPALRHRDGGLRAAALRVLHGADGRMALTHLVAALDDEEQRVRAAAIEGLRVLNARDPMRWAHAVFHARADVRQACCTVDDDELVPELLFYLLGDEACRGRLRPLLGDVDNEPRMRVPEGAYPAVLAFLEQGHITPDVALRLLHGMPIAKVVAKASMGRIRRGWHIGTLVDGPPADAAKLRAACDDEDGYDGLFSILARADDPRVSALRRKVSAACARLDFPERRRVLAAARAAMIRHGSCDEIALLMAALSPHFLLMSAVDIGLRRRAAAGLITVTHPIPIPEEPMMRDLMETLVLTDGLPDLAAAAGLTAMARAYAPLLALLPLPELLAAMAAEPKSAAAILMVHDGSKRGRQWLLGQIAAHDPLIFPQVLAWLAIYAPTDKLAFIEQLEPWQALELASTLAERELELETELKHNKRRHLVALLGARLTFETPQETVRARLLDFAQRFLVCDRLEERRFGRAMLEELAEATGGEGGAIAMSELADEALLALVRLTEVLTRLSYGVELALASVLVEHPIEEIRAWAKARVPATVPPPRPVPEGVEHLSDAQVGHVATCPDEDLAGAMQAFRRTPTVRLTEALARREAARPVAEVCAALLGCHDDPEVVAEQFARFSSQSPSFAAELERQAVRWEGCRNLPWLGSAWLWRWERHAFFVAQQMAVAPARPLRFMTRSLELPSSLLRARVWRALGEAVSVWAARDVARVHGLVAGETARAVVDLIVGQLDTDVGMGAAKLFVGLHRAGVAAAIDAVERVKALLPDVSDEARAHLSAVVNGRGLSARRRGPRERVRSLSDEELERVRSCRDPEALAKWCGAASEKIVQEAALVAIELGGDALARLSPLILAEPPVPCRRTLIESIALWPAHDALSPLRDAVDGAGDHELRFRLCLAFMERGEEEHRHLALSIAADRDAPQGWFRQGDYERLREACGGLECALALAASPQPHAYLRAVPELLGAGEEEERVLDALRGFLFAGSGRLEELRTRAAGFLHARGDACGFPLLLANALDPDGSYGTLFKGVPPRYVDAMVDAVLLAGPVAVSEARCLQLLEPVHVDVAARYRAYERLLVDAALERTAERVMNLFTARGVHRAERKTGLARVAQVFAWGTREGLALTRRRHSVHMSERQHLGYTRFDQDKIWVTALPILRGDRHAEQIVEALILHEIGHHRYHRGREAEAVWKEAEKQGLFGLLNLVADEHLERNLRALDSSYGDRLKRLAAHAFRHAHRDIPVSQLLAVLGHEALDVLSACRLGLARSGDSLRVESGRLLGVMERRGLAFARFMRALRLGLGDRYQDDKVAEALKLFPKQFKHYSMEQLLEVTEKLRAIFGWEAELCGTYGGHETVGEGAREQTRWGRGISDDEVQREVERVLDPGKRKKGLGSGDPSRLWINVSGDDSFEAIHNVQRVEPDRLKHREAARDVLRHARTLGGYLERLGLASRPARRRLRGTRLDRGRLTSLVTRRDPRVLVSHEVVHDTDLFLGVVVDCSGSMAGGDNIIKARRFAVLVAEAVQGLRGVDARFFGFTDSVIYDAGDARRCGAASLEAGGGNNDAAALLHAATVAKQSRRKAKVLVMISDGLPTECSTQALKHLVGNISRRGMCVAQVAVCPLEEVCFPHYVVLEGDLDPCVRRFGQVIAKLVSRAL